MTFVSSCCRYGISRLQVVALARGSVKSTLEELASQLSPEAEGLTVAICSSIGGYATLICDSSDEELGAIRLEKEFLALRTSQTAVVIIAEAVRSCLP
jgi:hypothetical protein